MRKRLNFARPYICRLTSFSRCIWRSTWPLLHGRTTAAVTAFSSRSSPSQNRLILRIPMMPISQSDLMPISSEASNAGLSQCELVIGIRQGFLRVGAA